MLRTSLVLLTVLFLACDDGDDDAPAVDASTTADGGGETVDGGPAIDGGPAVDASTSAELRLRQNQVELPSGTGSFDFGSILIASVGARYAFELENVGNWPATITSITVDDATIYSVTDVTAGPLAAGAKTTFTAGFVPQVAGESSTTLRIVSTAGEYTVTLRGTGAELGDLPADTDGDWTATDYVAYDTVESRIVVRVGDIDNLGFQFPQGFDPFSGQNTPSHGYPWTPTGTDPAGTDRIMVVTSYVGTPPAGQDGYTSGTSRPGNLPEAISMAFDLRGSVPTSAILQLFVDDFQAPVWGADYQVAIDGVRVPEMEAVVNALVQTGPIGKVITLPLPTELVGQLADGALEISIDDLTTGAGDGFALDFAKLYIDVYGFKNVGTISGVVRSGGQPLAGATVSASGYVETTSAADGSYTLEGVPAGVVYLSAEKVGFVATSRLVDLQDGQAKVEDLTLTPL